MANKNDVSAKILDDIFVIMQNLYSEMHLGETGKGNHMAVFEEFAKLGKTLVNADRVSFWRWDKTNKKLVTAIAMGVDKIVMVTGYNAVMLERHLAGNGIVFLRNEAYETTQMFESACIGLRYLQDKCDRVLIPPVDIPLFTAATVRRFTVLSVSPKYWRRSEWPMMTYSTPEALSMSAESSPV